MRPDRGIGAELRTPGQGTAWDRAEVAAVIRMQQAVRSSALRRAALVLSHAGEHAVAWLSVGALGWLLDRSRRYDWAAATGGVLLAHGSSVVVKRMVRRYRPVDPRVDVLVQTPSRWSFPSSHATSTTTAAVAFGAVLGRRSPLALVPLMAVSRVVLGVHYPTDVVAGVTLGAVVGRLSSRVAVRGGR